MGGVPVTFVGEVYHTGLGVGGGPMPGGPVVMPPIYYPQPPLGIWGPPGPWPTPPIVIPPDAIAPGVPAHPIYIPVYPAHPIVIPPDSIGPGVPAHPIVLPPIIWGPNDPRPTPPIVIPPDAVGPGVPAHPIVLPPSPPLSPAHPIVIPPPPPPVQGGDWVYSPVYGWVIDPARSGGKPVPVPPPAATP